MQAQGIDACITVQCRRDTDETMEFLQFAAQNAQIAGVVGWIDLTSEHAAADISSLKAAPGGSKLVRIRHIEFEDPDWLLRPEVLRGIAAVVHSGLTFDLLVRTRELPAAAALVARFPSGRFVLDHMAKPAIRQEVDEDWAEGIAKLASHANVWCKLSGLVTETATEKWSPDDFLPFIDHTFACFGAKRMLFGSDWPVCLLRADYAQVQAVAGNGISGLTKQEQYGVMGLNALAAYAIDLPIGTEKR